MTLVARLSPRDRRALLVGLGILLPALLVPLALRPFQRALTTARAQLETERDLLVRERRVLAGAAELPPQLQRTTELLALEAPRLFRAPDEVSATAALSGYVAERAHGHRVLLQQAETGAPHPVAGAEGVTGLTVTLRGVGDLEGILGFLHALEEGPRLVRVERLAIERSQRMGPAATDDEEVLSVAALVRGYSVR
jgi:hypothetical protein